MEGGFNFVIEPPFVLLIINLRNFNLPTKDTKIKKKFLSVLFMCFVGDIVDTIKIPAAALFLQLWATQSE